MCVSILKETNLKHPHQHKKSSTLDIIHFFLYCFFIVTEMGAEAVEGERKGWRLALLEDLYES